MLKELFESVKTFCTDQAKVSPVIMEGLSPSKRKKLVWNPESRTIDEIERDRPDNAHKLLSLDSVIDYVKTACLRADCETRTNIWIGPQRITVECTENEPGDIVSMDLTYSPLFRLLTTLRASPSKPQAEAVKLLRQQLSPFDGGAKALTAARNLKISTGTDYESEQSHVAGRIGKSVMQSAAGAAELPEYIDVKTPVYLKTGASSRLVRLWLAIDFAKQGHIMLEPDDAQMEEAMLLERAEILGYLSAALSDVAVAIYEGEYCVS
jgi:hypothetical protein